MTDKTRSRFEMDHEALDGLYSGGEGVIFNAEFNERPYRLIKIADIAETCNTFELAANSDGILVTGVDAPNVLAFRAWLPADQFEDYSCELAGFTRFHNGGLSSALSAVSTEVKGHASVEMRCDGTTLHMEIEDGLVISLPNSGSGNEVLRDWSEHVGNIDASVSFTSDDFYLLEEEVDDPDRIELATTDDYQAYLTAVSIWSDISDHSIHKGDAGNTPGEKVIAQYSGDYFDTIRSVTDRNLTFHWGTHKPAIIETTFASMQVAFVLAPRINPDLEDGEPAYADAKVKQGWPA